MTTITTLVGGDVISTADSMTKINTNFSNLNDDKIETSYLDTDTTLAANSDTKIATQKATKTYVDTLGNVNASETQRGIVEEATSAEIIAKTATGGTGARLFINPSTASAINIPGWVDEGALTWASSSTPQTVTLSTTYDVVKCYFYSSVVNGLTITVNGVTGTAYDYRRIITTNTIAIVTGAAGWDMGTAITNQRGYLLEITFTGKHSSGEKGMISQYVITDNMAVNNTISGRVTGDSNDISTITFTPSGNFVGKAHFYGLNL